MNLYAFDCAKWVDVDPSREFREYAGPVGIHDAETVGETRFKQFPPKALHCDSNEERTVIDFVDTCSVGNEWLYVLSLPDRAASRSVRIMNSEGQIVPSVVGLGADGRLCHYLYAGHRTGLKIEAKVEFDDLMYQSVRDSVGVIATQDEFDAVNGARTAYWKLHDAILSTVEDPPGIRWAVWRTMALSRNLGVATGEDDRAAR